MKAKAFLLAACFGLPCTVSAQQAVITERTLSLSAAMQVAEATLEACRKNGHNISVTVLNKAGRTKAAMHDDEANPHTIENSFRKAHTALVTRAPSGELGKRIAANQNLSSLLLLQNMSALDGGLPIKAGNDLIGAIGVSGAPGNNDSLCAQAGIDRIKAGL